MLLELQKDPWWGSSQKMITNVVELIESDLRISCMAKKK